MSRYEVYMYEPKGHDKFKPMAGKKNFKNTVELRGYITKSIQKHKDVVFRFKYNGDK